MSLALALFRAIFAVLVTSATLAHAQSPRIASQELPNGITSEVNGVVDFAFPAVAAALKDPSHWCEILMLHLDTKQCRLEGTTLKVGVVSHYDQPASSAFRAEFALRVAEETPAFLQVRLDAPTGPVGTKDYRIVLEAAPLDATHTSIRMSYSYSYGVLAKVAMAAYFATFGRGKVGFTLAGTDPDGTPRYLGGARGVSERNTMRYYLAVEAWLGAMSLPTDARIEKSLRDWYTAIERYPVQLHEMEREDYLAMKRGEFAQRGAS